MTLRYTAPYFEWIDGDGVPLAGGLLYFYASGTSTPLATYSDVTLSTPNANPLPANADGYWGPIFLQVADYKVVLKDANGVQIWSADPVSGKSNGLSSNVRTTTISSNITANDGTVRVNSASPTTQTLPTASTVTGQIFLVNNINTGFVTVAGTIDGGTNDVLAFINEAGAYQSNGTTYDKIIVNPFWTVTYPNSGEPDTTFCTPKFARGDFVVNTTPNTSPGTGSYFICTSNTASAGTWGGLGWYDPNNNFWCGRGVYGSAATNSATGNTCIGRFAGRFIVAAIDNFIIGASAGQSLTNAKRCILLGASAGQSLTEDVGHIFIGVNAGQLASVVPPTFAADAGFWSVVIGDNCASNCIQIASSVIIGRGAAFRGTTLFNDSTIVGHGAAFYADNITSVLALGNQAGGNPLDGSGTLGTWGIGTLGDGDSIYIGDFSGKSSAAALLNVIVIGIGAKVGTNSNTAVLGRALTDFYTGARVWGSLQQVTVTNTIGTTAPAGALIAGAVLRMGALAGDVTDTTDTAAAIIAASTGNGVEVGGAREVKYWNKTTGGHVVTLAHGTGVTIVDNGSSTSAIANGVCGLFSMAFTNTGAGTEAITITRIG